jgi:hypothetical protein
MYNVYFKPCALSQVSRKCSWRSHAKSKSASQIQCNRPDRPLKVSERPAMSRSFSFEDVQTSEHHRPNARSTFSNFYTELDFSRHYLGSFCKTSGRGGNTSGHYLAFQNIMGFLYECGKEWQWRLSGCSTKPSGRGPILGRITLFLKDGRRRSSGRGYLPSRRSQPESKFV